jgi:UMF1 family MFS transporter
MAGFFPIFFKEYWSAGVDVTVSTFRLGLANSGASLAVALLAPVLGALADAGGRRVRFLGAFAAVGIAMTVGLFFVGQGQWRVAALVYVAAVVGFSGSMVFYDSLLVVVAPPGHRDRVSALGFAVGYLGGGLLFALNVAMTLKPALFGLADGAAAVRASFLTVAVWWAVFTIPLLTSVREVHAPPSTPRGYRADGLRELAATFRHLRSLRPALLFLVAYWFYIDGVHTIVRMAVDYGLSIGFPRQSLITALLLVQFVGFPASLAFGRLADRSGVKAGIFVALGVYLVITVWAARMSSSWEFYLLAGGIGLVQGGVNALSRSCYARLIPEKSAAQFYGFYNALGRFSAVLGPVLMGGVGLLTDNPRMSILSVSAFFLVGALVLARVPVPRRS